MSKTRVVVLGPPVCAYCGEDFEGPYVHRRNADWHSWCWRAMIELQAHLQTVLQTNDVDGQAIPASSKDNAALPNG